MNTIPKSALYKPKDDKLQLITNALNVDVQWLLGYNVPMQVTPQNHPYKKMMNHFQSMFSITIPGQNICSKD